MHRADASLICVFRCSLMFLFKRYIDNKFNTMFFILLKVKSAEDLKKTPYVTTCSLCPQLDFHKPTLCVF